MRPSSTDSKRKRNVGRVGTLPESLHAALCRQARGCVAGSQNNLGFLTGLLNESNFG
jgi:hypothetical protein